MTSGDPRAPQVFRFGVFEVDTASGDVRKRGVRVRLQPQVLRVLELLLAHRGQVVTRDEFRERLWPSDTFVDFDHGLNKAVNRLREVLGDSAESPRFIETVPKRGYRFIASAEIVGPAEPSTDEPAARPDALATDGAAGAEPTGPPTASPARAGRAWGRTVLVATGLAAAALAVALYVNRPRGQEPAPRAQRMVLAVLPFSNVAGEPEQEYFCDGMTEEMIYQLSALRPDRLGVIARTSAMHYKNTQLRVDQIAGELNADYVLEGTVRRQGARVRITASLVRRDDQTPLWSQAFERDIAAVFEIQTEVARLIATSLALELLPDGDGAARQAVYADAGAYEAYLKARYRWNSRTPAGLEESLVLLEDAIARAPDFVPARAALADALNVLPWYGLRPPREAYPRSKELAQQALARDPSSAAAHTALAYANHYFDWNWAEAEREYTKALDLNPNYGQARQWLAAHHAEMGRIDQALDQERRAQELDPQSLVVSAARGWILYLGRRYDEAREQLERTLRLDPAFVPARLWLGQTLEAMGRPADATPHYLAVRRLAGTAPTGLGELARNYALAGDTASARRALDELTTLARVRYVEADLFARVHEGLGDRGAALDWLERGFGERAAKMVLLGVDPQYDRLREEPRFRALLARLNLPTKEPPAAAGR